MKASICIQYIAKNHVRVKKKKQKKKRKKAARIKAQHNERLGRRTIRFSQLNLLRVHPLSLAIVYSSLISRDDAIQYNSVYDGVYLLFPRARLIIRSLSAPSEERAFFCRCCSYALGCTRRTPARGNNVKLMQITSMKKLLLCTVLV